MRYIKLLNINRSAPTDSKFYVGWDYVIRTGVRGGFTLPQGANSDRPLGTQDGMIRYNTDTLDSEIYNISGQGTGWEKIKMNRQDSIVCQTVGTGDYTTTNFGPLSYNVDITKPQNVMVYVENVYQIPNTNYTLITSTGTTATTYISFTSAPPDKVITALLGFDNYSPPNS